MARPEITGKRIAGNVADDDLRCMGTAELCNVLGINPDTLRSMHRQGGDAAPPRIKVSAQRWGYPRYAFKQWLGRRMNDSVQRKRRAAQTLNSEAAA